MKRVCSWLGVFVALVCGFPFSNSRAGDWPTWRHDVNRGAAGPTELPDPLYLQWVRRLPAPNPSFPNDPRICADVSYEPVVAGRLIFVPSMVSDCVEAYDVADGRLVWRFFAEGPVRFAPVAWEGKVYFVSDDGCLYCVSAEAGKLLWRFRGVPDKRRDSLVLGNERLISRWPAKGAPVLYQGKVYFGSGVWPSEGVYVFAVDAKTGAMIWVNDKLGCVKGGMNDHGRQFDIGLPPLGYLAIIGGKLAVPCGRALPCFLSLDKGVMEPYTTGYSKFQAGPKGNWYVSGIRDYYFHAGYMMGASADVWKRIPPRPSEIAQPLAIPRPAPNEEWFIKNHPELAVDPADLIGREAGVFQDWALAEDAAYFSMFNDPRKGSRNRGEPLARDIAFDKVVCKDLSQPVWTAMSAGKLTARDEDDQPVAKKAGKSKKNKKEGKEAEAGAGAWWNLDFKTRWELKSPLKAHIKSGNHLYLGGRDTVAAVVIPAQGQPSISWQTKIEGTPWRILAAADRLFVVTEEGVIYCFGKGESDQREYKISEPPAAQKDEWTDRVQAMLKSRIDRGGYALVPGWGSGRLVEELARQTQMQIVVLEPEDGVAAPARERLAQSGLYGSRVHILKGDVTSFDFPPYFADLIVAETPGSLKAFDGGIPAAQVLAALRPYSGEAFLPLEQSQRDAFANQIGKVKAEYSSSVENGFMRIRRNAGLTGADEWTHEAANAANTFASSDRLVKPPFGLLWFSGSIDRLFTTAPNDFAHNRIPHPLVAGGRMFTLNQNTLHATDPYTGRHLWKTALFKDDATRAFTDYHRMFDRPIDINYIAADDCLYAIGATQCLQIDPTTGETRGKIDIPGGAQAGHVPRWREARVWNNELFFSVGNRLFCLDRHTGAQRWSYQGRRNGIAFAVGNGRVFAVDYWDAFASRRGAPSADDSGELMALNAAAGALVWRQPAKNPTLPESQAAFPGRHDESLTILKPIIAYNQKHDTVIATVNRTLFYGMRGATGERLWFHTDAGSKKPLYSTEPPVVLSDAIVLDSGLALDARTGAPNPERLLGARRGCGRVLGNDFVLTFRDAWAGYYDLAQSRETRFLGVRAGCSNATIPAGGILVAPDFAHGCNCDFSLFMSFALVPLPDGAKTP